MEERDELHREGLAILYQLARRYQPRIGDATQDGRFSGYAAMFLPRKLGDAWHAMHPEHRHLTDKTTGERRWHYGDKAVSLEAVVAEEPDRCDLLADRRNGHDLEARLYRLLLARARADIPYVVNVAVRINEPAAVLADWLRIPEAMVADLKRTLSSAGPVGGVFDSLSELRAALEHRAETDAREGARIGDLLGDGATVPDIAEILNIDTSHVREHMERIARVMSQAETGDNE